MSHLRFALRPLVAGTAVALAITIAVPPLAAHADRDPLTGGDLVDPVIGLLPPLPAKHTPYDGEICTDGSPDCIDTTIDRMRERLHGLVQTCDHEAIFSLAYLRVTEDVREASNAGYYDDPVWLAQVDAVFAEDYFTTMAHWDAGRTDRVPEAWRIALQAEQDRAMSGLGNFLLSMNAHINHDFPHVLDEVGLVAADGTSHKADHDAYNRRLDALYQPVFEEEAARLDPTFDDIDVGTLEETAAGVVMRGWREAVWRHAELLARARTPTQRRLVEQEIETYAAAQAMLIRSTFATSGSARRDAWCAEHGAG